MNKDILSWKCFLNFFFFILMIPLYIDIMGHLILLADIFVVFQGGTVDVIIYRVIARLLPCKKAISR